jgi:hypothetical protein
MHAAIISLGERGFTQTSTILKYRIALPIFRNQIFFPFSEFCHSTFFFYLYRPVTMTRYICDRYVHFHRGVHHRLFRTTTLSASITSGPPCPFPFLLFKFQVPCPFPILLFKFILHLPPRAHLSYAPDRRSRQFSVSELRIATSLGRKSQFLA